MRLSFREARKAWSAFAAGATVMLASGLITEDVRVWIVTAIAAVSSGIATYSVQPNVTL